jgi:hypothetical protein
LPRCAFPGLEKILEWAWSDSGATSAMTGTLLRACHTWTACAKRPAPPSEETPAREGSKTRQSWAAAVAHCLLPSSDPLILTKSPGPSPPQQVNCASRSDRVRVLGFARSLSGSNHLQHTYSTAWFTVSAAVPQCQRNRSPTQRSPRESYLIANNLTEPANLESLLVPTPSAA